MPFTVCVPDCGRVAAMKHPRNGGLVHSIGRDSELGPRSGEQGDMDITSVQAYRVARSREDLRLAPGVTLRLMASDGPVDPLFIGGALPGLTLRLTLLHAA